MLKLSKSGDVFEFECEGKVLSAVAARVADLAKEAASSDSIIQTLVGVAGGRAFVLGYSPEVLVIEFLEAEANENLESFVGIDLIAVRDICKNKAKVSVSSESDSLSIIAGRSKTRLNVSSVPPDVVPYVNSKFRDSEGTDPLPSEVLTALNYGTKTVEIKDPFKIEATLVTHLVCQKKKPITVLSFDNYHAAVYTSPTNADRDFTVSMPTKIFQLVAKFTDKVQDAKIFMDSDGLRVMSPNFMLVLPPVQANIAQLKQVLEFEKAMRKWGTLELKAEHLDNIKASLSLADPKGGSTLELNCKSDSKLIISMHGSRGESQESVKLKKGSSIVEPMVVKLDPRLVGDLMRKLKGATTFKVLGDGNSPKLLTLASDEDGKLRCWSAIL